MMMKITTKMPRIPGTMDFILSCGYLSTNFFVIKPANNNDDTNITSLPNGPALSFLAISINLTNN